jgi:Zn-dependent peptidase ImmA (M78 family)/transcriptional regulator with XRE-family HTH domain
MFMVKDRDNTVKEIFSMNVWRRMVVAGGASSASAVLSGDSGLRRIEVLPWGHRRYLEKVRMPVDLATVGTRLREARTNRGLSQEQAADVLGVTRAVLLQVEAGQRPITVSELDRYAVLYGRPVAEFVTEEPEELLVTLLRAAPECQDAEQIEAEILRHVSICRAGADLQRILGLSVRSGPPAYDLSAPASAGEAVEQGGYAARQERQRLGLGDNPIADLPELISSTGIWVSGSEFPDEMSGLFLRHPSIGMAVLVNHRHPKARKRFSYAHEYAHALLDRTHSATVSSQRNRTDLVEVRANAFAAAFLMPSDGVRRYLTARRKGLQSRMELLVYDPSAGRRDDFVKAMRRAEPGSQKITYQEVAILAHHFGVSYQAAAYRLKGLGAINDRELRELLDREEIGRDYLTTLALNDDMESIESDPRNRDRELISQVADLAIEAFRRQHVKKDKLIELGRTLGISGRKLVELAEAAL